jgi:hypothetical protein
MTDPYILLQELEHKYDLLYAQYVILKECVDDLICEAEVDHFLEHGPGANTTDDS